MNLVTYELVGPPGLLPGVTLVKAKAGDTIDFYATGFGKTSPAVSPGDIPGSLAKTVARPVVTVGGMWALFTFGLHVLLPPGEILGRF